MPIKKSKKVEHKLGYYDEVSFHLSELGRINLYGVINRESYAHVENGLLYLTTKYPKKPVTIMMNTPGGSVVDGLALYDAIMRYRERGNSIHIHVEGAAMSMGVPILQAATRRTASKHSAFLLHEVGYEVRGTMSNHEDELAQAAKLQKVVDEIILNRSNIKSEDLAQLTKRKDYGFTAQEALKHNLIDAIS
jgi:ATP-dependent Clp protease protease subunit